MNTLLNPETGEIIVETPAVWLSSNGTLWLKTTPVFDDKPPSLFNEKPKNDYFSIFD